ncbi:restriction endonuclease subunit S [Tenacibaculum finnmarkense]|uniref:restriction endonuclease subunit S n=1 Tax=Tenacibaculum finnmarkense TaxID=2781243 RepID=UPI00187B9722|nr:restriction endonuclease subunit S [Tenacibaculum finnmarkense]MBE7649017.1 hypothetical protein [Tenacibaculum finnmarkense genomovar ulcerans]
MEAINEAKIGYKKTKLGWIPEEWEISTLGEIGEIISGLTYSPKNISSEGILVLRSSNVQNRRLRFEDNVFVNIPNNTFNPIKEKDILICVRNGSKKLIGKNVMIPKSIEGVAFGAFMTVYRSSLNDFLFHLFDTDFYNKEIHKNLGATINSINSKDFKRFQIPLPPLPEQEKIAEILATWDTSIEKQQRLIKQLQERKKGLMQQLLTGKIRLKNAEGVLFSEDWEECKISDVANQYSIKNKNDDIIEVLSCTKYNGLVRSLEYFGRRVYGADLSKYKIVPRGYFAYATNHIEEGSIGFQNIMNKGLVSPMYTVFKTDEKIDDCFFFKLLKTEKMIYKYQSNMAGSIARRGGLRWSSFETLGIKIPSTIKEQQAIAQVLTTSDTEIILENKKLLTLQEQKKGLMQQLLTGAIRVK